MFPLIYGNNREAEVATASLQRPLVEELRAGIPVCREHELPTDTLSWGINTYVCQPWDEPDAVWWLLSGSHDEIAELHWCFAADAYVKPGGAVLLIRDEGGWR